MRFFALVLCCLAASAVIAGCASSQQHDAALRAPTLDVHIGLFGGPAQPDGGMADSNAPEPNARVIVTNGAGRDWRASTGAGGVARFFLRPGRYLVTSPTCGHGPQHVVVRAGRLAHVQIQCAIP